MSNKMKKSALIVCFFALVVSLLLIVIPSSEEEIPAEESEASLTSFAEESEPVFVVEKNEKVSACAMYIDGVFAGYYENKAEAEAALSKAAQTVADTEYASYVSYEVISNVTYKTDEYDKSQVENAGFEMPSVSLRVSSYLSETVSTSYGVEYVDDTDNYEGYEKVLSTGVNGKNENVYLVTYENGVETNRVLAVSNVLVSPVDEIVSRGVKVKNGEATIEAMFILPYDGAITSEYGKRYLLGGTFHDGVDIAAKIHGESCNGDPIHAAGDGVVIFKGYQSGFGNLVIIEHENGIRTYYAHQKQIAVKNGQTVKQGDVIGYIGSTGNSTGPHLHFEIQVPDANGDYYAVNPAPYIIDYDSIPQR